MLNETYRAMLGNKSVIRETFMYGKQRAAAIGYENVFDYSLGNPSVPCPPQFTEAMQDLLANEEPVNLHGYCPSQGDPGFRTDVAAHLTKTFGLPYEQKHIFPTTGAAGAIAHAIRAVTQPGDEVLTFAPYFPEYGPYVEGTGAHLRVVPPQAPAFQPNLEAFEQMLTEKVTCVLINTPNNPTGGIMEKADLEKIAQVVRETGILVISDEIYGELTYGDRTHTSFASLPDMWQYTITLNGFSKAFAMTGWRVGYACGPKEILSVMLKIHQYSILCAPRMGQVAALEALQAGRANDYEDVRRMRDSYDRRRRLMVDSFRKMGLDCFEPLGAFYVFPSIKKTGLDSETFCERLLNEYKIATVPGTAFGECGEGHIRCSYATGVEKLNIALERMSEFVDKCGK